MNKNLPESVKKMVEILRNSDYTVSDIGKIAEAFDMSYDTAIDTAYEWIKEGK